VKGFMTQGGLSEDLGLREDSGRCLACSMLSSILNPRSSILSPRSSVLVPGAEGGTRTPTGCPIRPSNVRVYQFHHFGFGLRTLQLSNSAPRGCVQQRRYFFLSVPGLAAFAGLLLLPGVAGAVAG
jgi:hypothetical protein